MASTSTGFKGKGPYNKSLKAKVVAVEESPKQYKGNDGTDKSSLTSAISDGETVMKVVCYNATKFAKFKVGNTLVLREVINKKDDSGQLIVVTKNSNVLISAPIEVPEEHVLQGEKRIKPEPSEDVEIKKALGSPLKKRISIRGKLVQEEEPRTVKVRGEDITIKSVTVEDRTGKAKVTLWRTLTDAPVRPGDYITITDVVVNHYNNITSLQTQMSKVEKCDPPLEKREVTVEAIGVEELTAELYLVSGESVYVPINLMFQALHVLRSEEVEMATALGPLNFSVELKGSETVAISRSCLK